MAEEKRAWEELEWEMAAARSGSAKPSASGSDMLYKGSPLKSYEKTQLEFELRKLTKTNQKKQAAPLIAELEKRGIGLRSEKYFWKDS